VVAERLPTVGTPGNAVATAVCGSTPAQWLSQPRVCKCTGRLEAERGDLNSPVPYLLKEEECRMLQHAERSVIERG
jgi:hypothetical protein